MKKQQSSSPDERIEAFLKAFSEEEDGIRNIIAMRIPAYNKLLSLKAISFKDFALLRIAKERGIDCSKHSYSYRNIRPACIYCKSAKKVYPTRKENGKESNMYTCKACNNKFSVYHDSIVSNSNKDSLVWMQVLQCLLNNYTVTRTCTECDINEHTYYNIRNRLFHAMSIMMEEVKLYGVVECDNTFVRANYKGYRLTYPVYPENSLFDDFIFIPRLPRSRGGSYEHDTRNLNYLCIFAAIDEYGHVLTRFAGIGNSTATKLLSAIPPEKYLSTVPETDPFDLSLGIETVHDPSGDSSLLVSDKESAILKYGASLNFEHEYHVFREGNVQIRLPEWAHDIQKVNALHSRLKAFLRGIHYCSSKYLPGYLIFFEFLENTGASNKAIGRLFEILTTPGYWRSDEYYDKLWTVPNYIFDWAQDHTLLRKLSYDQMLAVYLYHVKRLHEAEGVKDITFKYIKETTGFRTEEAIRQLYKNVVRGKAIEIVCENMQRESDAYPKPFTKIERPERYSEDTIHIDYNQIPPIAFVLYDDYCDELRNSIYKFITLKQFISNINLKYATKYNYETVKECFERIEALGLRPTTIEQLKKVYFRKKQRLSDSKGVNSIKAVNTYKMCFDKYIALKESFEKENTPLPSKVVLMSMLSDELPYSPNTISKYIHFGKAVYDRERESSKNNNIEGVQQDD